MTKEILEQILQLSKEKQIPEKEACLEVLGKYINLSKYKHKFGIEVNPPGKAEFTARRKRMYKIDDNYFSNINEVNSYYAGFIAADGNINKDCTNLTIILAKKDEIVLEKFIKNLKSDYHIRHYSSNGFPTSNLVITSRQICSNLKEYFNIIPNKSLIYVPPMLKQPYLDCFIIGLIDGDGTIGFSSRKICKDSLYITLVGTKDSCELVKNRFEEILGKTTASLHQVVKNKNSYTYRISDRNTRIVFLYFYEKYNYLPTLNRKWSQEIYEYCKSWKKSSVPSRQKGVNIFNLNGKLIKKCTTLKEADELTHVTVSRISNLCNLDDSKHQSKGYMFSRDKEIMEPYQALPCTNLKFLNKEQEQLDKGETNIENEI